MITEHSNNLPENMGQPMSAKELADTYDKIINYVKNRYTVLTYHQLTSLKEVLDQIEEEYNALDKNETDKSPIDGYNHRHVGRKPVYSEESNAKILALYKEGIAMRKIAEEVGCSYGRIQQVVAKDKKNSVPLHERRSADWSIYLKLCKPDSDVK